MNANARKFLVMVPVAFWGAAIKAVRGNLLNSGTGTVDNPLKDAEVDISVVANPRLTWTTKLAVYRTDGRTKAFIKQNEVDVEMSAIAEGSEEEFKNNRHLYGVKTIRNVGYGYWQFATLATLS